MGLKIEPKNVGTKARWQRPQLAQLGNLRDFVREGGANGKSGVMIDGTTSGNNEAMN